MPEKTARTQGIGRNNHELSVDNHREKIWLGRPYLLRWLEDFGTALLLDFIDTLPIVTKVPDHVFRVPPHSVKQA